MFPLPYISHYISLRPGLGLGLVPHFFSVFEGIYRAVSFFVQKLGEIFEGFFGSACRAEGIVCKQNGRKAKF